MEITGSSASQLRSTYRTVCILLGNMISIPTAFVNIVEFVTDASELAQGICSSSNPAHAA